MTFRVIIEGDCPACSIFLRDHPTLDVGKVRRIRFKKSGGYYHTSPSGRRLHKYVLKSQEAKRNMTLTNSDIELVNQDRQGYDATCDLADHTAETSEHGGTYAVILMSGAFKVMTLNSAVFNSLTVFYSTDGQVERVE